MRPEELRERLTEIKGRLRELTVEIGTEAPTDEQRSEWDKLNEEHDELNQRLEEYEARVERMKDILDDDDRTEKPAARETRGGPKLPSDLHSLEEYRKATGDPDKFRSLIRDGALQIVDKLSFPHPRAEDAAAKTHIERLLERDAEHGELAMRIINTTARSYVRAFGKRWAGVPTTPEEERALSLTTTAGGFAVPVVLDPTIIPTSNGSVNPFRQIARVESITTKEWQGVSSAGVTASYAAEAAEATDDAPTVAQPTATPERAHVFIPFSMEIGQDWGSLQAEMARLVQDAKDDLEATKFVTGTGTDEPEGLLVGATAVVATAAASTIAVADLYSLEQTLPPRFRPRASIVANRAQFNRVRQLDTAGGANLWVRLGDGLRNSQTGALGEALLGYPTFEASAMASGVTGNSSAITIGDFSHYLIAERIGMNVELLPHLLGSNRRPTGQRGLYFFWRNTADVLAWQAFRTLKVTA